MIFPLRQDTSAILLFGQDKALVDTRKWVLEKANFRVHSVLTASQLIQKAGQEEIELFLLCDSLTDETRAHVLALIHGVWPGAKRLVLMPYSYYPEFEPAEEVFMALEGPEKLVATIRTLMVRTPSSASVSRGLPT